MNNFSRPQLLRMKEVEQKIGLKRGAIYEKMNSSSARYDPSFPSTIKIGKRAVAWHSAAIDHWINSRPH